MIELPAPEEPAVSVIVLLDGAVELAEQCLTALAAGDEGIPFETVLLLNDPDAELEKFVRASTRGARVVLSRANAGPGVGWNLGAAVARAPRLATLHEDSEPDPGWLAPLVEAMAEHGAGAVGSRLYNLDGSVQNCGWVLFSDGSHQPLNAATAPAAVAASDPAPVDMLSGAAMLVDREALRAVGGWDERFHPAVFVDIDVSTALWNLGTPVLSVPSSSVRHQGSAFDRRDHSPLTGRHLRRFLLERNRGPFLEKWGNFLGGREAPPDLADAEGVQSAVAAALELTRGRADRIAAGSWSPPRPGAVAARVYSGLADPPVAGAGEGDLRVAAVIEAGLTAAETELVREYCLALVGKEESEAAALEELVRSHDQLQRSHRELHRSYEELRRSHEELRRLHDELQGSHGDLAQRLHQVLTGRTWRLRSALLRLLRRPS